MVTKMSPVVYDTIKTCFSLPSTNYMCLCNISTLGQLPVHFEATVDIISRHGEVARWGISGSLNLQTVGPKSVRSDNGRLLNMLCYLLLMLVNIPLQIVNRCYSDVLVSSGI